VEDIFNPYQEWLGWAQSRGPDYYELLAIDPAETDVARIALAAEQAMRKVRSFRPGPHAQVWSRLLDEIRAARDCLSNPALKADYDAALARTDRFRSSAGDLRTPLVAASLPPLAGSIGPAPIYDVQHQMVSVPTPSRTASSSANSFECAPLPGAIDELLPPGAEESFPAATEYASSAQPDDSEMAVFTAPTAAAVAKAKGRRARLGLACTVIGGAAAILVAGGIFVWRSSHQVERSDPTTLAEAAPTAASGAPSDAPAVRPLEPAEPQSAASTASASNAVPAPDLPSQPAVETNDTATPKPVASLDERRAKLQALVQALETAKAALGEQDFGLADEQLKRAASLAELPKHRAAVARLAEIGGYAKQFRDALALAVRSMQAADTFKVASGTEVAFVEGFPDKVTLHVLGVNTTYSFREMPPALALAIADRKLSARNPASAVVKGAYLAVHKQDDSRVREKAKTLWEEAEAGGIKTAHLMAFFTDNYADFLNDVGQ